MRRGPQRGRTLALGVAAVAIILGICLPLQLSAQDLTLDQIESLLRENRAFSAYRSDAPAVIAVFHSLKAEGLPTTTLVDLLREGAAKQVAPRLLLEALQNGAERVRTAASILKEARLWPSGLGRDAVAAREERVRRISIVLQGGVSPLIVSTLLEDSSGPNGSVALDRVLRLCETLVAVLQVARVPDPDLLSMAVTLLSSRLPEASFQSLPPLFVRGRVEGIDGATLAQTVTSIAARGGGIIQMDNEIRRLGGRR